MNGDRLKLLEEGFLDGKLTPEEETELKRLVAIADEHHLKTYFQWTSEAQELEAPDLSGRLSLGESSTHFWQVNFRKIAAAILILLAATFAFRNQLFHNTSTQAVYTQAEIDESYEVTMATLTAMASFLDQSLSTTEDGIDFSAPFKEFNSLKNSQNNKP